MFDFGDVVEAITAKMIRRHPHVFGDAQARAAGMAKGFWDAIKAGEKAERRAARAARGLPAEDHGDGWLDGVPVALPALTRALKLQDKAAEVGFDWPSAAPCSTRSREEIDGTEGGCGERRPCRPRRRVRRSAVRGGQSRETLEVDAETALNGTNAKFRRRFGFVERRLAQAGRSLGEASLADMEALWQQAKPPSLRKSPELKLSFRKPIHHIK